MKKTILSILASSIVFPMMAYSYTGIVYEMTERNLGTSSMFNKLSKKDKIETLKTLYITASISSFDDNITIYLKNNDCNRIIESLVDSIDEAKKDTENRYSLSTHMQNHIEWPIDEVHIKNVDRFKAFVGEPVFFEFLRVLAINSYRYTEYILPADSFIPRLKTKLRSFGLSTDDIDRICGSR